MIERRKSRSIWPWVGLALIFGLGCCGLIDHVFR